MRICTANISDASSFFIFFKKNQNKTIGMVAYYMLNYPYSHIKQ